MNTVAALFVRSDSVYKSLPGVDCWDSTRDASRYDRSFPVVCHPPCRSWGRLRQFSKPRPGEKELALKALSFVRAFGGVLEHPKGSTLFKTSGLPGPGERDMFGGFILGIDQSWFGHRARKASLLYICGCQPRSLPPIPLRFDIIATDVEHMGKAEREKTPLPFAKWLVDLASRCQRMGRTAC